MFADDPLKKQLEFSSWQIYVCQFRNNNIVGNGQNKISYLVNLGDMQKECRIFRTLLDICANRELFEKIFLKLFQFNFLNFKEETFPLDEGISLGLMECEHYVSTFVFSSMCEDRSSLGSSSGQHFMIRKVTCI